MKSRPDSSGLVLRTLRTLEEASVTEVAKTANISTTTARQHLNAWVKEGRVTTYRDDLGTTVYELKEES